MAWQPVAQSPWSTHGALCVVAWCSSVPVLAAAAAGYCCRRPEGPRAYEMTQWLAPPRCHPVSSPSGLCTALQRSYELSPRAVRSAKSDRDESYFSKWLARHAHFPLLGQPSYATESSRTLAIGRGHRPSLIGRHGQHVPVRSSSHGLGLPNPILAHPRPLSETCLNMSASDCSTRYLGLSQIIGLAGALRPTALD